MQILGTLKITSPVIIIIGAAMLFSSLISVIFKEDPAPLMIGAFTAITVGSGLYFLTAKSSTKNLGITEGCLIVTCSWLFACIFGAIPYYSVTLVDPAHALTFTESFFESVSGLTTTGASILTDIESWPRGILFWRSLSQWLGGMGIVILAIAMLPKIGVGGMQAFKMESPGPLKNDKLMPRISQTAKILYTVYLTLSIILFISLFSVGVSAYDSIIHTFSTIATGGFSNYNNSVAGLNNVNAEYIITFFMWLGGINFSLIYFMIWKQNLRFAIQNTEFKVYAGIHALAVGIVTFYLYTQHFQDWSLAESFRYGVFQVTSILTTSGFATANYNLWPVTTLMILLLLMFIGGCTGSTSGSMKVLRHIISFKFIKWEVLKIAKPNLITSIKIGNRSMNQSIVQSVIILFLLFSITFALGTLILTFYNIDLISAASASLATLSGVGPALNNFGPASNYANLPSVVHWVLIFQMFIGRLEIITVLILFFPTVWQKN